MDAMIDLETLGTDADAIVLSVGVVMFDISGVFPEDNYYDRVDVESQVKKRSLTADTFFWWMMQSDEARKAVADPSLRRAQIGTVWNNLHVKLQGVDKVWARGTHFDITILQTLFADFNLPMPWKYNAPRDSRTILDHLPKSITPIRTGIAHHALDDARHEAECVIRAEAHLRKLSDAFAAANAPPAMFVQSPSPLLVD